MSDNTANVLVAMIIAVVVIVFLISVQSYTLKKKAIENGYSQQVVGDNVVWVKP